MKKNTSLFLRNNSQSGRFLKLCVSYYELEHNRSRFSAILSQKHLLTDSVNILIWSSSCLKTCFEKNLAEYGDGKLRS